MHDSRDGGGRVKQDARTEEQLPKILGVSQGGEVLLSPLGAP
jgi:hypothetical protein